MQTKLLTFYGYISRVNLVQYLLALHSNNGMFTDLIISTSRGKYCGIHGTMNSRRVPFHRSYWSTMMLEHSNGRRTTTVKKQMRT